MNPYTGHGTRRDPSTATTHRPNIVVDIEAMLRWRDDPLIARVIEARPTAALRLGAEIRVADDGGKLIAEGLQQECDRLDLYERVKEAAQYERAYGGAAVLPVIDGAVGDLSEPFGGYEDSIGRVLALHVFEPRELVPRSWYTDVRSPKFRKPRSYMLYSLSGASGSPYMGVPIHESRLVIFPGLRVSAQTQPGQRVGWGDSRLNRVTAVFAKFGLAVDSAMAILRRFALALYKIKDLAEILKNKNGEQLLARRIAKMDMSASSIRGIVMDGADEYSVTSTPITGQPELLMLMAQMAAAAAEMPVMVFLGLSPTGLNANGGGDFTTRAWYDSIDDERHTRAHPIRSLVRLLALQNDGPCKGIVPEQWSIEWPPLWQPTAKERAEERWLVAQADFGYFDRGIASGDDIAESRWGGDTYSPEMRIDWERRAKQAALDASTMTAADTAAVNGEANPVEGAQGDDEPGPAEPVDTSEDDADAGGD
ncbi:MAG TPA: DUF1073 domain-containing protein [Kofleriaceae bacterium]